MRRVDARSSASATDHLEPETQPALVIPPALRRVLIDALADACVQELEEEGYFARRSPSPAPRKARRTRAPHMKE
jgi:hypothetical protein